MTGYLSFFDVKIHHKSIPTCLCTIIIIINISNKNSCIFNKLFHLRRYIFSKIWAGMFAFVRDFAYYAFLLVHSCSSFMFTTHDVHILFNALRHLSLDVNA